MNTTDTIVDVTLLPVVVTTLRNAEKRIFRLTGVKVELSIITGPQSVWVQNKLSLRQIVINYFKVTWAQICSAQKTDNIRNARHVYMFLCRELMNEGFQNIANEINRKDHSTVMSAYQKIKGFYDVGDPLIQNIEDIKALYKNVETIPNEVEA